MQMRPLDGSCRWACVSTPEPVRSMYQKRVGERMPKLDPPLGERLMWPVGERGAVATKRSCWARIHEWREGGMVS